MKNKVNKEKQRTLKVLLFSVLAVAAVALVLFLPSCSMSTDKLNDALKEYEDQFTINSGNFTYFGDWYASTNELQILYEKTGVNLKEVNSKGLTLEYGSYSIPIINTDGKGEFDEPSIKVTFSNSAILLEVENSKVNILKRN